MVFAISTYEALWTIPHRFEAIGAVVGLAVGLALSYYLDFRWPTSDRFDARGKLIVAICTFMGVVVGTLAK